MAAVTDKDAAFRNSMAAVLQRMTQLLLQAAELALPALAAPQDLNIGVPFALPYTLHHSCRSIKQFAELSICRV